MKNGAKIFKFVIIILLVVLIVVTILQNLTLTKLVFFGINFSNVPVIVIIIVSLLVGFLLGALTFRLIFPSQKALDLRKEREEARKLKEIEKEAHKQAKEASKK